MLRKKYIYSGFALIGFTVLFSGCIPKQMDNVKPNVVYVLPESSSPLAPGTIWQGESDKNMLYVDKKARYINDLVTIIISETTSGGNQATTNTSRDTSTKAGLASLLGLETSLINGNANLGGKIGLEGTASNSLKGTGNTTRGSTLEARISARVIRVLNNGNLIIEGKRQLSVNAEDQFIIITGIIRQEDIASDNSIASQYITDARIVYTGDGVINDKMRPGWMTRIADWVWPF